MFQVKFLFLQINCVLSQQLVLDNCQAIFPRKKLKKLVNTYGADIEVGKDVPTFSVICSYSFHRTIPIETWGNFCQDWQASPVPKVSPKRPQFCQKWGMGNERTYFTVGKKTSWKWGRVGRSNGEKMDEYEIGGTGEDNVFNLFKVTSLWWIFFRNSGNEFLHFNFCFLLQSFPTHSPLIPQKVPHSFPVSSPKSPHLGKEWGRSGDKKSSPDAMSAP